MSKITRAGQVTIPVEIRQFFNLREGDWVRFETRKKEIVLIPSTLISREEAIRLRSTKQTGKKSR